MINNGKVSTENSDSNDIASRISSIAMTKESDRNRKYDGGVYLERQPFLSNKENQLEDGMLSTLSAGKTAKMSATATKAIAYDMFIPGGNITLAIMLTFTAFVIFQKIIA